MATNRIIHEKSHNLYKIAQFKKKRAKTLLNVKFSDNLNVMSRSFSFKRRKISPGSVGSLNKQTNRRSMLHFIYWGPGAGFQY